MNRGLLIGLFAGMLCTSAPAIAQPPTIPPVKSQPAQKPAPQPTVVPNVKLPPGVTQPAVRVPDVCLAADCPKPTVPTPVLTFPHVVRTGELSFIGGGPAKPDSSAQPVAAISKRTDQLAFVGGAIGEIPEPTFVPITKRTDQLAFVAESPKSATPTKPASSPKPSAPPKPKE